MRNRKGKTPHIVVVVGEPLPGRIASLAYGTGDIDCIYHFALRELKTAAAVNDSDADLLDTLVTGRRLRDISDLPFDLRPDSASTRNCPCLSGVQPAHLSSLCAARCGAANDAATQGSATGRTPLEVLSPLPGLVPRVGSFPGLRGRALSAIPPTLIGSTHVSLRTTDARRPQPEAVHRLGGTGARPRRPARDGSPCADRPAGRRHSWARDPRHHPPAF